MGALRQLDRAYIKEFRINLRDVADRLGCCIVARQTNEAAFRYLNQPKFYTPKPAWCKAKTARHDVGIYRLAGLVPSPRIHPGAFGRDLGRAIKYWRLVDPGGFDVRQQARSPNLGSRSPDPTAGGGLLGMDTAIQVIADPDHEHFGCLRFHGRILCGDCDLADIVDLEHPLEMERVRETPGAHPALHGAFNVTGRLARQVAEAVNSRYRLDVIQHGPHFYFAAPEDEPFEIYPGDHGAPLLAEDLEALRSYYASRGWLARLEMHRSGP